MSACRWDQENADGLRNEKRETASAWAASPSGSAWGLLELVGPHDNDQSRNTPPNYPAPEIVGNSSFDGRDAAFFSCELNSKILLRYLSE